MEDFSNLKSKVAQMSGLALKMWQDSYDAFMEHDLEILGRVLEQEARLNAFEEELTAALIKLNRAAKTKKEKENYLIYTDVVEDLELIGDYCKDILERVQIKIEEKLLFDEEAVKEYGELYRKTEVALKEIVRALKEDDMKLVKAVLKNEEHIDTLVDNYRRRHNERVLEGVCLPFACNMFLNMLDFTAAVYYHAKKIARNLLKVG